MDKKKKSGEENNHFLTDELRAKRIFSIIEWVLFTFMIIGFFVNWKIGIGAVVFLLWSEFWYEQGRSKWVIDEYEQDGYPTEGLKSMFKSWVSFIIIAGVLAFFFL